MRTEPWRYIYRTLKVYIGYSHSMAFWAWVDYQQRVPHGEDKTLTGGALDAVYLEELFTLWGDEPGRVLNGLLKMVKKLGDGEAAAKRQIADDLDTSGLGLLGVTDQLDKMLPPIEVDDSEFDEPDYLAP